MFNRTWQEARAIVRRERIMTLSWLLAGISSVFSVPKLSYIDFQVLGILFCLMLVVGGLQKVKALDFLAVRLLAACSSLRGITAALTGIAFFGSMLITNDVALLTFVPLALAVGRRLRLDMVKIVILQTLAANLGSALTPMGNPQNLFIYAHFEMTPLGFMGAIAPLAAAALLWLCWLVGMEREQEIEGGLAPVTITSQSELAAYLAVFAVILLSVFHLLDFKLALLVTAAVILTADRKLLGEVDYALLMIFCGFFIFIGNISGLEVIRELRSDLLANPGRIYWLAILLSQFVSNVPATMLLAGLTAEPVPLLLGVNVGGLGTLLASMASVISYKLYLEANPLQGRSYLLMFLYYNAIGLLLLAPAGYYLLIC